MMQLQLGNEAAAQSLYTRGIITEDNKETT